MSIKVKPVALNKPSLIYGEHPEADNASQARETCAATETKREGLRVQYAIVRPTA